MTSLLTAIHRRHRNSDAVGSLATAFVIQAAIVVSGILAARILGPEDRGHLQILSLLPTLVGQLGFLGLPLAATYYIARCPQHTLQIIRTLARPLIIAGVVLAGLHALILAVVLAGEPSRMQIAGFSTIIAGPGSLAQVYGLAIIQGQHRFGTFNVLRSLQVIAYAAGAVAILLLGSGSLPVVALAWSLSVGACGAITLFAALRTRATLSGSVVSEKPPTFGEMRAFGLRSLAGWTNLFESFRLDQFFVGIVIGPAALGLYVAAMALTNLPRFLAQSIGLLAFPKIAAAPGRGTRLTLQFVGLAVVVCGGLVLALEVACGWLIPLLFGESFQEAVAVARVLLAAAFVLSLKRVLNDCVRGQGRPELGTAAEVTSWLPLVPAFWFLGSSPVGVAWILLGSSFIGLASLSGLVLFQGQSKAAGQPLREVASAGLERTAA